MELLIGFNLFLRFLLELAALWALGVWGFQQGTLPVLHWVFGLGAPLLFALAWGRWAAPTSPRRLKGFPRLAFEAAVFGSAASALVLTGRYRQALFFMALVVFNTVLLKYWKKW